MTYPDGTQTKITNDLQSYQGISLSADASAFVTLQDSAEVDVWTARSDDRFGEHDSRPRPGTMTGSTASPGR